MAVPSPEALRARFLEVHESAYGYANPHDPIEIVNVRLTARGRLIEPPAPPAPGDPGLLPEPFECRPVWFAAGGAEGTAGRGAGENAVGDAAGAMRDTGESAAGGTEGNADDSVAGNTGENARRGAGVGAARSPGTGAAARASGSPSAGSTGPGLVDCPIDKGAVDCPVYDRRSLRAGHILDGPAIVEQLDSTTPIFPGDRAVVDPSGNLVIRIRGGHL